LSIGKQPIFVFPHLAELTLDSVSVSVHVSYHHSNRVPRPLPRYILTKPRVGYRMAERETASKDPPSTPKKPTGWEAGSTYRAIVNESEKVLDFFKSCVHDYFLVGALTM